MPIFSLLIYEGEQMIELSFLKYTPRYQEWEEFAKVGVNLLERLESFLEPLGPMDSEDEEEVDEEDNFID